MSEAMKQEPRAWTTAEAAFIVGEPLATFKKVVERSPVGAEVAARSDKTVRRFGFRDLVYLCAYPELKKDFTTDGRVRIYRELLKLHDPAPRSVDTGDFVFNFGRYLEVVQAKTKTLNEVANKIDTSQGEALIKGTAVEAHRVAALLDGGMTPQEVLKDYPTLTKAQVLAAQAWAIAHPKPGRPFPKRTAKAAMRDADLSALDEFLEPRK